MRWTPRQLAAHLHFLDRELAFEDAKLIGLTRLAMHGKDKDVKDYLATLIPEV